MVGKIPDVTLNNGKKMPVLGLGTYGAPPGEMIKVIKDAIDVGYRHFDCAHFYGNEDEIGEAINAKLKEGVVKREELFITSKIWNTFQRKDLVRPALETTLKNLGLPYIDLYLIHWPTAYKEGDSLLPMGENGKLLFSDADYLDTYKELEKLVDAGLTKSIGISNFNAKQVDRIVANARIQPVTNQVECHPYLNQNKLAAHCHAKKIILTSYSPLGSPYRPWAKAGDPPALFDDTKILAVAQKYKKSVAHILIRYQIDKGNIVIPKSANKQRMIANADVFDFKLTKEDIALLDSFDCNGRFVPSDETYGHPNHPFENDKY